MFTGQEIAGDYFRLEIKISHFFLCSRSRLTEFIICINLNICENGCVLCGDVDYTILTSVFSITQFKVMFSS